MESYFKRFFIGYYLIAIVVGISFYVGLLSLGVIIVGVLLFEFLIYFLDAKYLPKRKTELANRLIEIFNAEPFSKGVMKFQMEAFDLFAEIEVDYKLGLQLANVETVRFHIRRNQIDRLPTKPGFELKENKIDGIQTYNVYETDGMGLKLAKEELEKML